MSARLSCLTIRATTARAVHSTPRAAKPIESLADEELEAELTVAAPPPNGRRRDRFETLLREKRRGEQRG